MDGRRAHAGGTQRGGAGVRFRRRQHALCRRLAAAGRAALQGHQRVPAHHADRAGAGHARHHRAGRRLGRDAGADPRAAHRRHQRQHRRHPLGRPQPAHPGRAGWRRRRLQAPDRQPQPHARSHRATDGGPEAALGQHRARPAHAAHAPAQPARQHRVRRAGRAQRGGRGSCCRSPTSCSRRSTRCCASRRSSPATGARASPPPTW